MPVISPKPEPPTINREQLLEDVSFVDVDLRASQVPEDKLASFESLVEYLTQDIKETLLVVRVLFTWLGKQDILNTNYDDAAPPDTPKGMLKSIKEDLFHYNQTFMKLCRCANIHCSIIEGYRRLLTADDDKLSNHWSIWCAVYIKGWRFVVPRECFITVVGDTTGRNWQRVEQDGSTAKENDTGKQTRQHFFNDNFFLMDPVRMIYFYRPNNDKWQLLKTPMSQVLFMSQPYVYSNFFDSGLLLKRGQQAEIKAQHGRTIIVLPTTKAWSSRLKYAFYFRTGQEKEFPDTVSAERFVILSNPNHDGEILIDVRFPVEGIYRLNFYSENRRFLLKFILKCEDAKFKCKPLPINPDIGWGPGKEAKEVGIKNISHTEGVIHPKATAELVIEFQIKPGTGISTRYLSNDKPANDLEMKKRVKTTVRHGDVRIGVNPIEGEAALEINSTKKGHPNEPKKNIINYLISTEDKPKPLKLKETPLEKIDKSLLKKALQDGKLSDIKDALASYKRHDVEEQNKIITEATEKIILLQVKRDLQDAKLRRHRGTLEQAIAAAEASEFRNKIMNLINEAKAILEHLQHLDKVKIEVLEMKQSTISELHKYNHPKQVVHDVMMATFALVGEKILYLEDWEIIQALMRRTGKLSLIRKIRTFDISSVEKSTYSFAKEKIDKYEEGEVRLASAGVGTFYKWCKFTISEITKQGLHLSVHDDEDNENSQNQDVSDVEDIGSFQNIKTMEFF